MKKQVELLEDMVDTIFELRDKILKYEKDYDTEIELMDVYSLTHKEMIQPITAIQDRLLEREGK